MQNRFFSKLHNAARHWPQNIKPDLFADKRKKAVLDNVYNILFFPISRKRNKNMKNKIIEYEDADK